MGTRGHPVCWEVSRTGNHPTYGSSVGHFDSKGDPMRLFRHARNRSGNAPVGIAARLGSWSAEHRKTAVLSWLVLVLIALAAGNVGSKKLSAADLTSGDSQKAERALEKAGFKQPAAEQVLIQANGGGTIRT